jgi:hypothetical protein
VRPSVIASPELPTCEIPIGEVPKWIRTHGFGVLAFRCPGLSRVSFPHNSLAAKFRWMKPQNEQGNTCIAISRIAKVDEYPPIRPVAITADQMSADKG